MKAVAREDIEALRRNQLVYRRDDNVDTGSVFSRTLREYWDFRPLLDRMAWIRRESMKQK